MQAFLAILRYDLGLLFRSWITRIWIPLLVAPALFLVVVAANENELASETLAAYVTAVLIPISGLAIAVLGTGAKGDGPETTPLECKLSRPHGLLFTASGLYVTDSEAHRIRLLR